MTMHTEGPWSVAETRHNYDTVIRGPKGEPIALALIAGYTKQEWTAHAALLAAAPDLLDALRLIATAQERGFGIDYAKGCALAAIRRATGELP